MREAERLQKEEEEERREAERLRKEEQEMRETERRRAEQERLEAERKQEKLEAERKQERLEAQRKEERRGAERLQKEEEEENAEEETMRKEDATAAADDWGTFAEGDAGTFSADFAAAPAVPQDDSWAWGTSGSQSSSPSWSVGSLSQHISDAFAPPNGGDDHVDNDASGGQMSLSSLEDLDVLGPTLWHRASLTSSAPFNANASLYTVPLSRALDLKKGNKKAVAAAERNTFGVAGDGKRPMKRSPARSPGGSGSSAESPQEENLDLVQPARRRSNIAVGAIALRI